MTGDPLEACEERLAYLETAGVVNLVVRALRGCHRPRVQTRRLGALAEMSPRRLVYEEDGLVEKLRAESVLGRERYSAVTFVQSVAKPLSVWDTRVLLASRRAAVP